MEQIEKYLTLLSKTLTVEERILKGFLSDLKSDTEFLAEFNKPIKNIPEFDGTVFKDPGDLRVYRV